MAGQVILVALEKFLDPRGVDLSGGIVCRAWDEDGDGGLDWAEAFFPAEFEESPQALIDAIAASLKQFLRARFGGDVGDIRVSIGMFEELRSTLLRDAARIIAKQQPGAAFPLSLYHILGPERMAGFPRGDSPEDSPKADVPPPRKARGPARTTRNPSLFDQGERRGGAKSPPEPQDIPGKLISPSNHVPLVLEEDQRMQIRQLLGAIRNWDELTKEWGIGILTGEAGLCGLFHGPPGTGKTQAARLISSQVGRSLLVVGAQEILHKYVGDTEKAIERLFSAAEEGGYILLFDEADSFLFSRDNAIHMWEVSHVNAVLQRMERTKAVALFTTNLVEMLDPAVERRMLFKIRFSPPGLAARKSLWRALVPRQAPQSCLDYDLLAEVELTGGEIKNAILAGCIEAVSGPGELTTDLLFALALEAADHRLHDIYEEERRLTGRSIGFGPETTCG